MDILLSPKSFPITVISDMAPKLVKTGTEEFSAHLRVGYSNPLEPILATAKQRVLQCHIKGLSNQEQATRQYSLADRFHKGNLTAEQDILHPTKFAFQLASKKNMQVAEQLFCNLGRDCNFLTQMQPHFVITVRLILHLHNETVNLAQITKVIKKNPA
jgi:hypothetical protein